MSAAPLDAAAHGFGAPSLYRRMRLGSPPDAQLAMRPLCMSDYAQWRRVGERNQDDINQWMGKRRDFLVPRTAYAAMCWDDWRERVLRRNYRFGVFDAGVFCGEVSAGPVYGHLTHSCSASFWIDSQRRGEGLAGAAVEMLVEFLFSTAGFHRVQMEILPANTASLRVACKLGFIQEGAARGLVHKAGSWCDYDIYALIAEDRSRVA